ncbi:ATP-binding protein [Bacillus sp. 31A1R]|uniref:histidine kinase n=1 Tax=Robertmurraya mangrovi TaxID=3098077 RepID=A0ABU5ITR7_9BACI|nr:ATP-binding protein [Bacillus sp. 31A1R]MDZ5470552.1 ATP-binding protein [Bacillus sp. 31A1R]
MKSTLRNIFIYLLFVGVPTVTLSFLFINHLIKQDLEDRVKHAKWEASIHETHWDQFITETVNTVKILSLTVETTMNNPEQMKPLLQRAQATDPRYGGLFLLDDQGMVVTGSNTLLDQNDFTNDKYILDVIKTKDVIISNKVEKLQNGQEVIGLAGPVLDRSKRLEYVIVALLRVDYIQNIMKVLTPETELVLTNTYNELMISYNLSNEEEIKLNENWVTYPITRLPWNIVVHLPKQDHEGIIKKSVLIILSIFSLMQISYIFIKYLMLKRQAIAEKKQNEAQKLELVGTLAASTAHEIRNPLTGIKGLVQLLSEKYRNDKDDQFYFSVINEEIKRINQIVSEFLILGKPTALKMETCDLRTVIQDLHPLISSEANLYHVNWTSTLPIDPVIVSCTRDQMKQVILNVTKNSLESMSDGGNLNILLKREDDVCKIDIIDTGIGIKKEDLEKIFIPFYTSKDSGTGLGLVVCKRIINSFGGDITIRSQEQKGTTVTITLPLIKQ